MKKLCALFFTACFFIHGLAAQGMPVLDVSNLTQSIIQVKQLIDQLNAAYDQVKNSYQQVQQQIDMVKNLDLEKIDFSSIGNINLPGFGGSLKSAQNLIESNLTRIKEVKDSISSKKMSFGGKEYSVGGLLGLDDEGEEGSLRGLTKSIADHVKDTGKAMAEDFKKKLKPEEIAAIGRRYGLSPENYASLKMTEQIMDKTLKDMFITGSEEHAAAAMKTAGDTADALALVAEKAGDSLVAHAEAAFAGINSMITGISQVEESVKKLGSLMAQQEIVRRAREEIEADLREAAGIAEEALKEGLSKLPEGYF